MIVFIDCIVEDDIYRKLDMFDVYELLGIKIVLEILIVINFYFCNYIVLILKILLIIF